MPVTSDMLKIPLELNAAQIDAAAPRAKIRKMWLHAA